MPNFDTDSQVVLEFNAEFFAANNTEADSKIANLLARVFPSASIALMEQIDHTSSTLVGMDIAGANHRYEYKLHVKMGDSTVVDDDPDYVSFEAASAAAARAVLDVNAQRVTN